MPLLTTSKLDVLGFRAQGLGLIITDVEVV